MKNGFGLLAQAANPIVPGWPPFRRIGTILEQDGTIRPDSR